MYFRAESLKINMRQQQHDNESISSIIMRRLLKIEMYPAMSHKWRQNCHFFMSKQSYLFAE